MRESLAESVLPNFTMEEKVEILYGALVDEIMDKVEDMGEYEINNDSIEICLEDALWNSIIDLIRNRTFAEDKLQCFTKNY
jgi:hypothetical protein